MYRIYVISWEFSRVNDYNTDRRGFRRVCVIRAEVDNNNIVSIGRRLRRRCRRITTLRAAIVGVVIII